MPVPKNKPTTPTPVDSTAETSAPILPEQEDFRQHLRRLAVSAVQVLLEQVMREELEQCIGASWGECTPTRRGYRNGSYTRDLVTPTGHIELTSYYKFSLYLDLHYYLYQLYFSFLFFS
jgi:putative transposase